MNKRGQGLSVNALILIILGIVVLAVMIIGFTMGWQTFAFWLGGDNNVNTIVTQCTAACSLGSVYDFCTRERILKAPDLPEGEKQVEGSCHFFATTPIYSRYGIDDCSGFKCPDIVG